MQKIPTDWLPISERELEELPLIEMKYKHIKNYDHLICISNTLPEYIQGIINIMGYRASDLFKSYELCYLDVKVRNLKEGDSGDHLNQIHTDWTQDFNHPNKQETHLLYTNTGKTKFFELVNGEYKLIGETEPNSIYKYNREFHQSPIVEKACKRVMARLSFVDRLR